MHEATVIMEGRCGVGEPSFARLECVLRRSGVPDRVPLFELGNDLEHGVLHALGVLRPRPSNEEADWHFRQHLDHQLALGYDYVKVMPANTLFAAAPPRDSWRAAEALHQPPPARRRVASRADFDRYPWPRPEQVDYRLLERAARLLPSDMRILSGTAGVLETTLDVLGLEGIGYLLADDEPLVAATFDRVGAHLVAVTAALAEQSAVGALFHTDDLAFRTQTLLSPAALRRYVLPWHRRVVEAAHRHGKPIVLRSGGRLEAVAEDVLSCGWDARHGFEDVAEPVWQAKERYGSRIALLGGFDVDRLARSSADEVRAHTRYLLEHCAPGGGYALGTGRAVGAPVPVENYLAMVDAAREWSMGD
jgi:uroporphyrinogen decarboxylase